VQDLIQYCFKQIYVLFGGGFPIRKKASSSSRQPGYRMIAA
jgi:hypothetical protein